MRTFQILKKKRDKRKIGESLNVTRDLEMQAVALESR